MNIAETHVRIMCIFHCFIDFNLFLSNSHHSMLNFHKEYTDLLKKKYKVILPTTMLTSLVIHNSFVSDVFVGDISDMKCQLCYIYLKQYFIQPKHDQN